MTAPRHVAQFYVRQKVAMTVNRYEVVAANADGTDGALLGFAQQKRIAAREKVTFYTDESRQQVAFGFTARKRIDLGSGYDVTDADGTPIGSFKKDFAASLLRSTFLVEGAGFSGRGQERSPLVSLVRRFVDLPLRFHFDFVDGDGRPLFSIDRQRAIRDRYTVTVPDPRVDHRLAAAIAVACDALMSR